MASLIHRLIRGCVVVGLLVTPASAQGPQGARAPTIRGVVVTRERQPAPVRNAVVELNAPGIVRRVVSDANGRFDFANVQPGTYVVRVFKAGYVTSEYGAVQAGGPGKPLVISAQSTAPLSISVGLVRGAVLAGTVRDMSGDPAPAIVVTVEGPTRSVATTTDYRGRFRVHSLVPGEYTISAKPALTGTDAFWPAPVSTVASNDRAIAALRQAYRSGVPPQPNAPRITPTLPISGYANVYYPGVVDGRQAGHITLKEGEVREDLDFALLKTGTSRIRGTVVSSRVTAVQAIVTVTEEGTGSTHITQTASGTFEIGNLAPGAYSVVAKVAAPSVARTKASDPLAATDLWAEGEVVVGESDVQDVQLVLQPAMELAGHVAIDTLAGTPLRPTAIRLALFRQPGGVAPVAVATPTAAGRFALSGLGPGTYRLVVTIEGSTGSSWRIRSVAARQRDLLDAPIAFGRQEGSVTDAVITMTTLHSEITGVLKSAGDPSRLNYVIAFPRSRDLWSAGPRRVRAIRPATDGQFHFVDLPAGDYFVAVLTDLPSDWQTSTFLEQASAAAVAVRVADGETTPLELQTAQ